MDNNYFLAELNLNFFSKFKFKLSKNNIIIFILNSLFFI